jgi:hypothetical protein
VLGRETPNGLSRLLLAAVVAALGACGGRSDRTTVLDGGGTAGAGLAGNGGTLTGSGGTATTSGGGTTTSTGGTTTGTGGTTTSTGGTTTSAGGTTTSSGGTTTGSGGTTTGSGGTTTSTGGTAGGGSGGTTGEGATGGSETGEGGAHPTSVNFSGFLPGEGSPASFYWEFGYGNWFVVSPSRQIADAPIDDIVPPRDNSTKAVHVSGADYGVEMDVYAQLNHPYGHPVDLSRFTGLTFWARLAGDSSTIVLVLNDGSFYLPKSDDFSMLPSGTFTGVSDAWQEYAFDFDPSRVSSVVSIDFVVQGGGDALDLWLDDVTLLCSGACY